MKQKNNVIVIFLVMAAIIVAAYLIMRPQPQEEVPITPSKVAEMVTQPATQTHTPPHPDIAPPPMTTDGYVGDAPIVAWVCNVGNGRYVNARSEDSSKVIGVLEDGDPVVYIGEVTKIGGETWQPTDQGLIDPKHLCTW